MSITGSTWSTMSAKREGNTLTHIDGLLTKNHVPGVLCMPSLTRYGYIQPGPLKKTGRLTTQDIGKTLALKGACQNACYVKIVLFTHFLLTSQFVGTFARIRRSRINC